MDNAAGPLPARGRRWLLRIALVVLLLTPFGFIAPLSTLPNPIGLYYLARGGYEYEPDSQFVNRFALLGSRNPQAKLDLEFSRLIGKTGLDPLDPVQPLVSYRILNILTRPRGINLDKAAATIEFRFADGSARTYQIPVYDRIQPHEGRGGWRFTGLDRPLAAHQELPWLPLANDQTAIELGMPTRLPMAEATAQIASGALWSTAYLGIGTWAAESTALRALPDGQAFLVLRPDGDNFGPFHPGQPTDPATLWLIPTDGGPARRVDDEVSYFVADSTGRYIAYARWRDRGKPDQGFNVVIFDRETGSRRTIGRANVAQVAIAGGHVFFLNRGTLSRAELARGPASETVTRPDAVLTQSLPAASALAVSPDGTRIAYRCLTDLCLVDSDGSNPTRLSLGYRPPSRSLPSWIDYETLGLAWSADGQRLAITFVGCCDGGYNAPYAAPKLRIADRSGNLLQEYALGPDGPAWEPQWTPDGRFVFVNAFPRGGRRIVAIDTAAGRVADLSRPGWDAFFSLAQDGKSLLLWNGRGGFWTVPVERR